jgi:hypothetical protein
MATLKAVVRDGRAVLVDDRVDYPEGTELQLDVRDPGDELDADELAEFEGALDAAQRGYAATWEGRVGRGRPEPAAVSPVTVRIVVLPTLTG